ncbi:choice-of-anchor I family protein [Alteromonadaceae bacterium BrNp21-10]|nr:choice-of-anchor I family protein [Alteromonadaceae bacterium BrNp21-10]
MQNKFVRGLLAASILAMTTACVDDGNDGVNGSNGVDGTNGSAGEQGTPGADGQSAPQSLAISMVGRFVTPAEDKEGAAEIVQYHVASQMIYAINSSGAQATIEIIDASDLGADVSDPLTDESLTSTTFVLPTSVTAGANTLTISDANSIAIHGDLLAVAMAADAHADNGAILFYDISTGTPALVKAVEAGNLPDMVTFTPDGSKALVANEGEPSGDYLVDPEGSVSIITITDGMPADTATQVTFTAFNGMQAELEAKKVRFSNPGNSTVAQDLEPEYIATSNSTAYVAMQENNAMAKIDLTDNSVEIFGLGYKDWSINRIDVSNKDGVNFNTYAGLYGLYMPDTITMMNWKGADFILTANEGDAREYFYDSGDEATCLAAGGVEYDEDDGCLSFIDEARVKDLDLDANSPLAINYDKDVLGRLKVIPAMGDTDNDGDHDELYAFGARSFSIWDSNGLQVFDSGDDFGRITAAVHGEQFNNDEDANEGDARSDDKGGEPEALTVGKIGQQTYAFVGLERMSSIFVYDVTNPYDVRFVDYFYNRDLTDGLEGTEISGDLAPEGMKFVAAEDSPTGEALLITGNEISGSVAVWQIKQQ